MVIVSNQNLCLVGTAYSLFLYLLINGGYNEDDLLIFTGWFPKDISKNVSCIQLPFVLFIDGPKMASINTFKGILENIWGYIKYFYGYLKLRTLLPIKTRGKTLSVYGHAQTPFSYMFYENENVYIIEDGLLNYSEDICKTHQINPIIDKLLHFCGIYFINGFEALGSHKNVKKVFLTHENNHPLIKDKVEVINIKELWDKLDDSKKGEILNIFNVEPDLTSNNREIMLLLQPLAPDGLMNEDEEISIYKKMIGKYERENIVIKSHPRDERDFKKIFPDYTIIEGSFPVELLNIIGIKPKKVLTVLSTGAFNFQDSEIEIYDGEFKNKKLNKSRDNLIKLMKNT